jgi:hypothetical protein
MSTIRQEIEAKIANLDAAYTAEKGKLVADLAAIGPLAEHEIEALKSWIAPALKLLGL